MVYEIATLDIKEGSEAAFEAAVKEAAPFFQKSRGCRGLSLERSVEKPSCYYLVVTWDSVEDHMVHFRNAPEFQEWRRLASPHFASAPSVEHTSVVGTFF
ncbi:antibiotic biosynthesis monooxygenase family protein [Xanthobacter autotrophicus]|uniref:antibiotic biosynthesis monooxygenase family protein n=1 Tax=Xanthobacter autotrophicus TaxID=280 RepID=UPI0024A627E1|nr:antibiotic biosynthesis monooxygenase [Xanthobacter autotrophicus]MDI4657252.1 antibiotic biosynthesis monooxygenase [Xanthobacter autotrophicus]